MQTRFRWAALAALLALLGPRDGHSQAAPNYFLDSAFAVFKPYSHFPLRLGNGFAAVGGDTVITVKLVGNDAFNSGTLWFVDPVSGEEHFLFANKDSARFGQQVVLGRAVRDAPIVFKYVNSIDGKAKYTGANLAGSYRFDGDPELASLAINNRPLPVSEQVNNLGDRRWAVAGRISRTEVLFGFEDLADVTRPHDFNDIVFIVTGVQLDSEIKLAAPLVSEARDGQRTSRVTLSMPAADTTPGVRILYTLDGTAPFYDDQGRPLNRATTVYAGPFTLSGNTLIKAQAWRASLPDSTSGLTSYLPSAVVSHQVAFFRPRPKRAVYLDADGDGRIDGARIALTDTAPQTPASLFLEDPFRPGREIELRRKDLRFAAGATPVLEARFPDRAFAFGTGFPEARYGTFPEGSDLFPSAAFTVADSVGPVLTEVESHPPQGGQPAWIQVTFSEEARVDPASRAFPYALTRLRAGPPAGEVEVAYVRPVDARTWVYILTPGTPAYPFPGDSLRLLAHPSVTDLGGLQSGMGYSVPVKGPAAVVRGDIAATGGAFTVGGPLVAARPLKLPVSVVRMEGGPGGTPVCLDCRTGEWRVDDPARPAVFPLGPSLEIRTRGPFAFDISFFGHLGEFVNRARGTVTAAMLADVPMDAEGLKTVHLMWYPVSAGGAQAATGAYIAQGSYQSLSAPAIGPQGEPLRLAPVRSRIQYRFGYVRR